MQRIKIFTNKNEVTFNEVLALFKKCGWGSKYSEQSAKEVLDKSELVVFCRKASGELIGLLRVARDGKYSMNIIDIVIHPDYQSKNIGSRMMNEVKKHYNKAKIYIEELNESNNYFFVNRGFKLRNSMDIPSMPLLSKLFMAR